MRRQAFVKYFIWLFYWTYLRVALCESGLIVWRDVARKESKPMQNLKPLSLLVLARTQGIRRGCAFLDSICGSGILCTACRPWRLKLYGALKKRAIALHNTYFHRKRFRARHCKTKLVEILR